MFWVLLTHHQGAHNYLKKTVYNCEFRGMGQLCTIVNSLEWASYVQL
jgi:hypothetical protein